MRALALITATIFLLFLLFAPKSKASNYSEARKAIYKVFGPYASEALQVARCETGGTYDVRSHNGQYVNLFQMGYSERQRYGWHVAGSEPIVAARAAFNYFRACGYSWRAWSCQPW